MQSKANRIRLPELVGTEVMPLMQPSASEQQAPPPAAAAPIPLTLRPLKGFCVKCDSSWGVRPFQGLGKVAANTGRCEMTD